MMVVVCVLVTNVAFAGTWGVLTYDGAHRSTQPYLSSLSGGEQGVGAVRSPVFALSVNTTEYRFLANGWDGQGSDRGLNYYQLCDAETGKELRRTRPPGNDFFQPVVWDVRDLAGRRVYLRAVDGLAEGAFAWFGCKDVPLEAGLVKPFRKRESPEGWCEEIDGELRPLGSPVFKDPKQQIQADWEEQDRALGVRWEKWKAGGEAAQGQRDLLVQLFTHRFHRADRMLSDFGGTADRRLKALRSRFATLKEKPHVSSEEADKWRDLSRETRWALRDLAFTNPVLKRLTALLFVQRYTQQSYSDINVNHLAWGSAPGGDLCLLSPISPEGTVRRLVNGRLGPGNAHGVDLTWDGKRVVFAYSRASSEEPPDGWTLRQRTFDLHQKVDLYHLYEMNIDGSDLRQITQGPWSDLNPCYLPGGKIAFESERCGFELNCNEMDKDEPTTNLFGMNPDGSGIQRLTVTKDGDWYPRVLNDGRLIYSHWEYHERDWSYMHPLWTVWPDGSVAEAFFKQHLNLPATLTVPRAVPGSRKILAIATGHHTLAAGAVVLVDSREGMNNPAALERLTGPSLWPEYNTGTPAPGPSPPGWRAAPGEGWYMDPYPLSEKYYLASYCDGAMQDETGYGIYLMDVYGGKELIYRDPTISSVMPIPVVPRPEPPVLAEGLKKGSEEAFCFVADIENGIAGIAPGTVRYLRISEPVAWPYMNESGGQRYEPDAKATGTSWTPIRILGTVPVERDGSAHFRVPSNTALYFQALDENWMEVRRMRSYVSFQPGETRGCVGCHETRGHAPRFPSAYPAALRRAPSSPQPPPWGDRPLSFLRDVQPVLDRHCVQCHAGLRPAGGVDLCGGLTAEHNRAYDTLVPGKTPTLLSVSNKHDDARISEPKAFGSHRSKLLDILRDKKHSDVKLSPEDHLRLVTWIDANAVYHDRLIDKRPADGVQPYNLAADEETWKKVAAIQQRRCASCHANASLARPEWVNLKQPEKTLFLSAPLAKEAGGKASCRPAVFQSASDRDYKELLALVEESVAEAWKRPRRDLVALSNRN